MENHIFWNEYAFLISFYVICMVICRIYVLHVHVDYIYLKKNVFNLHIPGVRHFHSLNILQLQNAQLKHNFFYHVEFDHRECSLRRNNKVMTTPPNSLEIWCKVGGHLLPLQTIWRFYYLLILALLWLWKKLTFSE